MTTTVEVQTLKNKIIGILNQFEISEVCYLEECDSKTFSLRDNAASAVAEKGTLEFAIGYTGKAENLIIQDQQLMKQIREALSQRLLVAINRKATRASGPISVNSFLKDIATLN